MRICLAVNHINVGGCSGYTLQPSALTPVTDQDTDFDTKCAVYIFSQSAVVPVLFHKNRYHTSLLGIHTHIMIASPHTRLSCGHEIGTTAGLSGGVIFAKENRRITGCGRFQRILLTHCCLPCCSAMNC